MIDNPILRGFEPDASVLRVGDDYYIATSTFEWYPGVRLHHSRDLVHGLAMGGALPLRDLADLAGVPDSGGIWAPCLTHVDGLFHLVFTVVDSYADGWADLPNYVTTARSINGPWSPPVPLHARGFDASLFHDDDGTSWLLSMRFDWRPDRPSFAGIELQRYDRTTGHLFGTPELIFTGTEAGVTEGPHLYKRQGWYYLTVAEGGTGYRHQATVARSRTVTGPYEPDPNGALLGAHHDPALELQKSGHVCLVETQQGEWYATHITARPDNGRSVLGRETAIQPVIWTDDGWPRIEGGVPAVRVPAPALPPAPVVDPPETDHFDGVGLGPEWSTLRRPASPDWVSLTDRRGHLSVHGGQSPSGLRSPSLVARRVTAKRCDFGVELYFSPRSPGHLAGITAYYNTRNWHYLYVTAADDGSPALRLLTRAAGRLTAQPCDLPLPTGSPVVLRAEFDGPSLRFGHAAGDGFAWLPYDLDATILSDEHADEIVDGEVKVLGFTGAMLGLWVQDLDGSGVVADFTWSSYAAKP